MPDKEFEKFNVPSVLKAIHNTYDPIEITRYENILVCMFASPLMAFGAVINLIISIIRYVSLQGILWDTVVFIVFTAFFEILMRQKMPVKRAKHLISALYSLVYMYIVFSFFPWIGSAVWTIGFIMVILAMLRNSKSMVIYMAVTVFLCGLAVTIFPSYFQYKIDVMYYIMQYFFFTILFAITMIIQQVNSFRQRTIVTQLKEVNKQIEERKKAEEKTAHLAMYDYLTDLPNRILFHDRLNQAIRFAERNGQELFILFLDIDFFKIINDTLGHTIGDEVIIQMGSRLNKIFRKSDTVSRISGDEFLVLMQNAKQPIDNIMQNILREIRKPIMLGQQKLNITCSIGIAKFPSDGNDAETLIKHADMAMYKAKSDGKNSFAYFSDNLRVMANMEMELISNLHLALKRNELQLYYQPQVDCSSGKIIGLEALIRWNHPKLGQIKPMDFISLAERTGLIVPLGEWVIRSACRQNKTWQEEGLFKVPVTVNISVKQMENNDLAGQISRILIETGLSPKYLELEFSEGSIIKELDKIKKQLYVLKKIGVNLSIDNFGKGYSSIHYLRELPVKRIKIPIDFVRGINNNAKDESIISVIIALAKNLHLGIVAEGVETKKQMDFLEERYCMNMQGYYFSEPMPAGEMKDFMLNKKIS